MPDQIFFIEVERIIPNPYQPRREFDEDALRELAESIREYGVLEPLILTRKESANASGIDVSYELVAGERRLKAAKLIGLHAVPALVKDLTEKAKLEIALIENIQRENLNAVDRARAFARLMDEFQLTQLEIASRVHKSRSYIANTLRILKLPEDVQRAIAGGRVTEAHARLILAVEDAELQAQLFQKIMNEGMSVRETKSFLRTREPARADAQQQPVELALIQQKLEEILRTRVEIKQKETGAELKISFSSLEELIRLIQSLASSPAAQREDPDAAPSDAIPGQPLI